MELLAGNPYTYRVRARQLLFTAEFKRRFWEQYERGGDVQQIFENMGYDPLVVGYTRMHSVPQNLRKVVEAGRPFTDGYSGRGSVLLTDITYIPYNGTFCYLSTILDAYTKQVLSYAVSSSLELDFVLECINLLVEKHGVSLNAKTLIHSDQESSMSAYITYNSDSCAGDTCVASHVKYWSCIDLVSVIFLAALNIFS